MEPVTEFQTAAVIGTGMMGPGIGLTLAMGGLRTTIVSRSAARAEEGVRKAARVGGQLVDEGLADAGEISRALGLLSGSDQFEETIANSGLVIESAPEDLAFKQELFARLEAVAPRDAVLASNTSGLSITAIAARCARPERILTTHFWNPPHLVPLVEVVPAEKTDMHFAEAVRDLLAACGKTPVVIRKDRPGMIGNRLQMALVREAANIVAQGIADADAVDAVVKHGLGIRMPEYGLLEHMDIVGLDLALRVVEYVVPDLYNEPRAPEYMREMVRRGNLGAKTGHGFYDWSAKNAEAVKARRDRFLAEVLRFRKRSA